MKPLLGEPNFSSLVPWQAAPQAVLSAARVLRRSEEPLPWAATHVSCCDHLVGMKNSSRRPAADRGCDRWALLRSDRTTASRRRHGRQTKDLPLPSRQGQPRPRGQFFAARLSRAPSRECSEGDWQKIRRPLARIHEAARSRSLSDHSHAYARALRAKPLGFRAIGAAVSIALRSALEMTRMILPFNQAASTRTRTRARPFSFRPHKGTCRSGSI